MNKNTFFVIAMTLFSSMIGLGVISPLLPIYAKNLQASGIWLGAIFIGFAISRAIFMPFFGSLSDKKGRKKLITWGLLFCTLVFLLYPIATNYYILICVRLLHGITSAMILPTAMAYAADLCVDKGTAGKNMAILNIAIYVGMGAGPFLGGVLNDVFGLAPVFYCISLFSLASFFFVVLMLPAEKQYAKSNHNSLEKQNNERFAVFIAQVFRDKLAVSLLAIGVVDALQSALIMVFLPVIFNLSNTNISSSKNGILVSLLILVIIIFQHPFGSKIDRIATEKKKLYVACSASIVGKLLLFSIPFAAENYHQLLILIIFLGIAASMSTVGGSAVSVLIGKRFKMGSWMGIFITSMSVGMIMGPLLGGVIMDSLGVAYVFYILSMFSIMLVFFSLFLISVSEKSLKKIRLGLIRS